MSDIKLLPCPFCGGEALLEHDDLGNFFVRCRKCFCRTPMSISKFFPITAWNTRKPMQKIVERLEEQAEQYHRREKEHEEKNVTVQISNKYFGKACSYEHAIEIVKEVGLDESNTNDKTGR